jgi:tetratricopeptide (TPR) repeat protein
MNRSRISLMCTAFVVGLFAASSSSGKLARGQSDNARPSELVCTLKGVVRDSDKQLIAGAAVFLQSISLQNVFLQNKDQILTARTDAAGVYCFSAVQEGDYSVRAEKVGYENSVSPQFRIGQREPSTLDLTLVTAKASGKALAAQPQFFDEPHFTVAGVTDTTNVGGHGSSNALFRNRESLIKETAALGEPSAGDRPAISYKAAETSLRQQIEHEPSSFDANYHLGKLLVEENKADEAISYLERASKLNPGDYENSYELALAYFDHADYGRARNEILSILGAQGGSSQGKGEPHHLLGEVCEKLGDPVEAAREFQRAAEFDASEPNLFDWGTELLLHRAAEPAVEVFTKGSRLFPGSVRMRTALGASWYELGSYEKAAQSLCEASDLDPNDATPYLFMGKMEATEVIQSVAVTEKLQRFVKLQPENALASYYYAVSLWKARAAADDAATRTQVKSLLMKSVQLDPKLGVGYLQLGIVCADEKDFVEAISAYQQAIAANPELEQAHYRLAQVYRQSGEPLKARDELQLYEKISKQNAEESGRERREVQQFVYELKEPARDASPK